MRRRDRAGATRRTQQPRNPPQVPDPDRSDAPVRLPTSHLTSHLAAGPMAFITGIITIISSDHLTQRQAPHAHCAAGAQRPGAHTAGEGSGWPVWRRRLNAGILGHSTAFMGIDTHASACMCIHGHHHSGVRCGGVRGGGRVLGGEPRACRVDAALEHLQSVSASRTAAAVCACACVCVHVCVCGAPARLHGVPQQHALAEQPRVVARVECDRALPAA
jgi:hypothetical protein